MNFCFFLLTEWVSCGLVVKNDLQAGENAAGRWKPVNCTLWQGGRCLSCRQGLWTRTLNNTGDLTHTVLMPFYFSLSSILLSRTPDIWLGGQIGVRTKLGPKTASCRINLPKLQRLPERPDRCSDRESAELTSARFTWGEGPEGAQSWPGGRGCMGFRTSDPKFCLLLSSCHVMNIIVLVFKKN
jgi:hypothetical protein